MTKAVLAGLQLPHQSDLEIEDNLAELAQLAEDAGLVVTAHIVQRRGKPVPATYVGLGKLDEIKSLLDGDDYIIIFDDELTPAQQGNCSEFLDAPVLDRSQLILDIFARRAWTKEGKIQVELAQLKYLLPRLAGHGTALSRLGGGIGTRGPGETKLETDRRRIRKRIADLEAELDFVRKVRQLQMSGRKRSGVPLVTLVGYTNAGKSALFSALTDAPAFVEDQLFATLDPLIRKWQISESEWVYLSDTVGFMRKLPHTVIAAFRATLEEVLAADLLLHVLDASHPLVEQQKTAVDEVLREIGCDTPIISVYNKIDKVCGPLITGPGDLQVSALTKANLESVGIAVSRFFASHFVVRRYLLPFDQLALLSVIHEQGEVFDEQYQADGVLVEAKIKKTLANRLNQYEVKP
ncbi:MAG: GTPase HflX [Firmicutes bacterium]|jgi:GTP-binding protein HflX|nr:GTPase HflX [Bacillota bacterium]NLL87924.1 GTPase HflX [Bacillota bacterium]HKM16807.1 GTPase HflX [Limnochordia bacterium]